MIENFCKALEELKRVDHLVYVSLKYTRTVDVIKSAIDRLVNSFDFGITSLLEYSKEKKKITEYPDNAALKCELVKKLFSDNGEVMEYMGMYALLRKLNKAEYTKREEYRKNVTMIAEIDNSETIEINTDVLKEYYEKTKTFAALVKRIIEEQKGE